MNSTHNNISSTGSSSNIQQYSSKHLTSTLKPQGLAQSSETTQPVSASTSRSINDDPTSTGISVINASETFWSSQNDTTTEFTSTERQYSKTTESKLTTTLKFQHDTESKVTSPLDIQNTITNTDPTQDITEQSRATVTEKSVTTVRESQQNNTKDSLVTTEFTLTTESTLTIKNNLESISTLTTESTEERESTLVIESNLENNSSLTSESAVKSNSTLTTKSTLESNGSFETESTEDRNDTLVFESTVEKNSTLTTESTIKRNSTLTYANTLQSNTLTNGNTWESNGTLTTISPIESKSTLATESTFQRNISLITESTLDRNNTLSTESTTEINTLTYNSPAESYSTLTSKSIVKSNNTLTTESTAESLMSSKSIRSNSQSSSSGTMVTYLGIETTTFKSNRSIITTVIESSSTLKPNAQTISLDEKTATTEITKNKSTMKIPSTTEKQYVNKPTEMETNTLKNQTMTEMTPHTRITTDNNEQKLRKIDFEILVSIGPFIALAVTALCLKVTTAICKKIKGVKNNVKQRDGNKTFPPRHDIESCISDYSENHYHFLQEQNRRKSSAAVSSSKSSKISYYDINPKRKVSQDNLDFVNVRDDTNGRVSYYKPGKSASHKVRTPKMGISSRRSAVSSPNSSSIDLNHGQVEWASMTGLCGSDNQVSNSNEQVHSNRRVSYYAPVKKGHPGHQSVTSIDDFSNTRVVNNVLEENDTKKPEIPQKPIFINDSAEQLTSVTTKIDPNGQFSLAQIHHHHCVNSPQDEIPSPKFHTFKPPSKNNAGTQTDTQLKREESEMTKLYRKLNQDETPKHTDTPFHLKLQQESKMFEEVDKAASNKTKNFSLSKNSSEFINFRPKILQTMPDGDDVSISTVSQV